MISDFVKGKKQFDYPAVVHKGILLHRAIDEFTDTHPVTKKAKVVFQADYRLYSGAFIDVAYDHFLATDKTVFETGELYNFSLRTYEALNGQLAIMPDAFRKMFFIWNSTIGFMDTILKRAYIKVLEDW
nr:ACP phosphodiesterase [Niabella ginsengisoli]